MARKRRLSVIPDGVGEALFNSLSEKNQQLIREFEYHLKIHREMSPETVKVNVYTLSFFINKYKTITKENALMYKRYLVEQGFAVQTINQRVACLNNGMAFIKKPLWKVKGIKLTRKISTENIPSMEEYTKLIEYLKTKNIRDYFFIKLLANTGARISEALKITKEDIIRGYADLFTKGRKCRRIYIPKAFKEEFLEHFTHLPNSKSFAMNRYGDTISSRGIATLLKIYADEIGIAREKIHPHAFRHFFAIHFLKNDSNIALLADLMGHDNIQTTALYLQMSHEEQHSRLNNAVNW